VASRHRLRPGLAGAVPLVLGQLGFLDRFTITFHPGAAMLVLEDWDVFDLRFGTGPARG
jgi:hypothetical protein